ncbi:sensor histidine kinase [Mycolicibacterium lacusdiani]|uniref:sensor histidine kinase n=1 Tax=Mycolicibacterium lacusdiani TaxID=2895283 RepID=UPI001F3C8BA3|nr:ATP-binding protein [Mycolicibacterium lacusdiani]
MNADGGDTSARMRPRARLMLTIGLELISSDTVAVTELVKNSFDADADFVLVRLSGTASGNRIKAGNGMIEVLDDGVGMSSETIVSTWLEPATSSRRRHTQSNRGRRMLGEKGVGRFAAAKLAEKLELTSRAGNASEVRVQLDWTDFADEDKYLDEIAVDWVQMPPKLFTRTGEVADLWRQVVADYLGGSEEADPASQPTATHGTLLRMESSRIDWTAETVAELQTTLSRLVSPFALDRDVNADFTIVLEVPPELGLSGVIEPPEQLKTPHYTLEATVDTLGHAVGSMRLKDDEPMDFDAQLVDAGSNVPSDHEQLKCGPYTIRLRAWDRDVASLREIAGDLPPSSVRSILDTASGVSIYRDGFRVLPYGEQGDDWLGLDLRRVNSPTQRLSNNQVVGYLQIGRDTNPMLIDQTNREGLVDGPALQDLRTTVLQLLLKLENARYNKRPRREKRRRGGLLDRVDLSELSTAISARIPSDDKVAVMITDLQRELDQRQDQVGEVLARYHRLATLGQLVDRIVHELSQPLVAARQAAALAIERIDRSELAGQADIEDVRARLSLIRGQMKAAGDVLRRVEPFGGRRRGRPPKFKVEDAVANAVGLLQSEMDTIGATVSLPEGSTTVTVDGTELQEVIVNLLKNSLHWIRRVPKGNRHIAIDVARNSNGSVSLSVEDSGPGVDHEARDHIFEPYFTTREGGVGLGLSIAGEIVEDFYGGTLELLPPGSLGGANFRATLRKRVEQ